MTYCITKIQKPGYKALDIFVLSIRGLSTIPKTIIFIDIINEKMALMKYLYIKLLDNSKDKVDQII